MSLSFLLWSWVAAEAASTFTAEPVVVLDNGTAVVGALSKAFTARRVEHRVVSAAKALAANPGSRAVWVAGATREYRAEDAAAVLAHLRSGGGFLVLGDMPFQQLLYPLGERWLPESAYLEAALEAQPVLKFAATASSRFTRSTSAPEIESRLEVQPAEIPTAGGPERRAVAHVVIPKLTGWTTFGVPLALEQPDAATCFWARGTEETRQLALEWDEQDGSRWIAKIDLTPEWRYYVLLPEAFHFFYDSPTKTRGQRGDRLRTENTRRFSVGLAFTHTALGGGPHEFWVSDICRAHPKAEQLAAVASVPPVDGLYPGYMGYPVHPARLEVSESFRGCLSGELSVPASGWSAYWRPLGSGYDKDRRLRFIPVVTARNADGTRAGTLAQLTLQFKGQYAGAVYGSVSVSDQALLLSRPWLDLAAEMVRRMQQRSFFQEAGSAAFTYDVRDLENGSFTVGLRTVAMDVGTKAKVKMRVKAGVRTVWRGEREQEGQGRLEFSRAIPFTGDQSETRQFRAELYRGGAMVDVVEQEIGFDGPRQNPVFLKAQEHNFTLGGKPYRAFGVNYMPSSGCASTDGREFEFYLEDRAYDPEIVEADLGRIEQLGMNAISIFLYSGSVRTGNLPDILRRARRHHLMVNLGLRPAADAPLAPRQEVFQAIIPRFRLAEKAEILAYDIAWEPWWGGQGARARFGPQWRAWVVKKYGSIEAAEQAWAYAPPRLEAFPLDEQLDRAGAWLKAVNDYRDFVDETLNASYGTAREQIRELDPNHLVSFRQSEGANPLVSPGLYPMDLASVSRAVDFFSPEGYGVGDSQRGSDTMVFAAAYAQGLAPGKPIIWAEYGMSVWNGSAFTPGAGRLEKQAGVFRNILAGAEQARAAGTFAWWFPGGYRTGEDSDFGILNPDGTDRPVTQVIRHHASTAKAPALPVNWRPAIRAKRADSVRGYAGIYERIGQEFFRQVTSNSIPVIISRE